MPEETPLSDDEYYSELTLKELERLQGCLEVESRGPLSPELRQANRQEKDIVLRHIVNKRREIIDKSIL